MGQRVRILFTCYYYFPYIYEEELGLLWEPSKAKTLVGMESVGTVHVRPDVRACPQPMSLHLAKATSSQLTALRHSDRVRACIEKPVLFAKVLPSFVSSRKLVGI